jgi:hypothetical protein
MLYSFNKQYPKLLPERVRLEDGSTRTGLALLSVAELEKLGFVPVSEPPAVPQTSTAVWSGVNWTVREKTEDELRTMYLDAVSKLIPERNQLLRDSDWTQLPDTPGDKAAWAAYRQQLRDISLQPEYPYQVTWPEAPV